MVVTIQSKYSILQYCSCQAINLLTTVCLSLIAAHVCLPSLLPLPLIPVGLRGEWDRKEAPGCKLNSFGVFLSLEVSKIKLMHYFVVFSMRSFYRNTSNLEPSWRRRTGTGTIRARRVPEFVQMSLLWKFILAGQATATPILQIHIKI